MSESENEDDIVPPLQASQYRDDSGSRHEGHPPKKLAGPNAKPGATEKDGGGRSKSFNAVELRLLSEAFMQVKHSADKKTGKFWDDVGLAYRKLVRIANDRNKSNREFSPIDSKRGGDSLRSCWSKRLHPAVQKFALLVSANPPSSEQLRDEHKMDLYYANIRRLYNEETSSFSRNFPKNFSRYMKSYHFLTKHPMFQVEFPIDGSKPPPKKPSTSSHKCNEIDSDQPNNRTFPLSTNSPSVGSEPSTQTKPIDQIDDNQSKSVSSVSLQSNQANKMSEICKSIINCLDTATEQMKSILNHQIMSQAPLPMRKKYFEDLHSAIAMEAANKRRRLELEAEELAIRQRLTELKSGK